MDDNLSRNYMQDKTYKPALVSSSSSLDTIMADLTKEELSATNSARTAKENTDTTSQVYQQLTVPKPNSFQTIQQQAMIKVPPLVPLATVSPTVQSNVIHQSNTYPSSLSSYVTMLEPYQHGTMITAAGAVSNSIPEFLYQLSKMLTDDNREIIEWTNGKNDAVIRSNDYKG